MEYCKSPYELIAVRKFFSGTNILDSLEEAILFVASEFPEECDSRRDRFAQILCTKNSQPDTTRYLQPDTIKFTFPLTLFKCACM